ncbi:MAG: carboxypeptidase-like regulatory domain-containing protein [Chloroflexota bacterium]
MRLNRSLTLLSLLVLTALFASCGGTDPAPTAEPPIPTPTIPPTDTPQPTATPMPTATPTAVPAAINGRVLWGQEPVPGAIIELRALDWRETGDETAVTSTTTGAAGQFLLASVPPGEYDIVAVWPDGTLGEGSSQHVALEPGGGVNDLTLKLERPLTLLEPDLSQPAATLPTILWEMLDEIPTYRVLITDRETDEPVIDQIISGDRLDIYDQLQPSHDYSLVVSALGPGEEVLARYTGAFTTVETPTPPRAVVLPAVCAQPGLPNVVSQDLGICFAHPSDYAINRETENLTIDGPPVSASFDPLYASLTVTTQPAGGLTLDEWVEQYVAGFDESSGKSAVFPPQSATTSRNSGAGSG